MLGKRLILTLAILVSAFGGSGVVRASEPDAYSKIQFEVEHSGDPEVRKAAEVLIKKGILKPDRRSARPAADETNGAGSDCFVSFNQRFLSNILEQDQVGKKLPSDLLELNVVLAESCININGRLDGPAFVNPKFAARLDLGFSGVNSFKIRVSEIRVAGFSASLFTRMISGYIEDAVKRAFPKNCSTKVQTRSGGIIDIDVKVDPEGFVPGISKVGFLSDAGIRQGKIFFCFSIPQKRGRR
ncbi:MAG: hypothetical protein KKB51_15515 [Candidatus Riflebacteria bacterium]|nr:hypothetical protein [Candidatus Riflebacteria bacterium]